MRRLSAILLLTAAAAAAVVSGVAVNQILDNGRVSWHYAYLALLFGVLAVCFDLYRGEVLKSSLADRRGLKGRFGVYTDQLRASVAHMETLGLLTQGEYVHRMEQVYVDVALRPRTPQDTAIESLEIGAEAGGGRHPLTSFLEPGRTLAVIGSPGSGKTTLVRHTALNLCVRQWRFRRRRVPVLIYLRDHAAMILGDEPCDLSEVAGSAKWLEGRVPSSWLAARLAAKRCVVLLDGLDEVADAKDRKKVVAWIDGQMHRYQGNAFVLTSRPHGYLSNPLPTADILQVQRFTTGQIARFLRSWYYANDQRAHGATNEHIRKQAERRADDLFKGLRNRVALYHLAANPLLLTMIAHVHRYRGALPGSRAALYAEMCDVLIHRRQESKNLADATGLDGPKKESVVRQLAFYMMVNELRDIRVARARGIVEGPLAFVAGEDSLSAADFLEEVRRSGLLVEREQGVLGFAHLTLQEYLAAAHIRENPEYLPLITRRVDHAWWRETTLLWAASGDATPVITACLDSGTFPALALAFDCADEARRIEPAVRARLDHAMRYATGDDSAESVRRRRLVAAVTLNQRLRDIVWVDDRTAICAQPVTRGDYNLFVPDEHLSHRYAQRMPIGEAKDAECPASGIVADDAARFVHWVNGILQDGRRYRLPTPDEMAKVDGQLIPVLADHAPWVQPGRGRIQTAPAHGRRGPRLPGRQRLLRLPGALIEGMGDASTIVRIGRVRPWADTDLVQGYADAFGDAVQGTRGTPHQKLVVSLDYVRDLLLRIELALPDLIDVAGILDAFQAARAHCGSMVRRLEPGPEYAGDRGRAVHHLRAGAEALASTLQQYHFYAYRMLTHRDGSDHIALPPTREVTRWIVERLNEAVRTAVRLARDISALGASQSPVDPVDLRQAFAIAERIPAPPNPSGHGPGAAAEWRLSELCRRGWAAAVGEAHASRRSFQTARPFPHGVPDADHAHARRIALALTAAPGLGRHVLGAMTTYEVLLREAASSPLSKRLAELVAKTVPMASFAADDPAWNLRQAINELQHVEFWHATGLDRRHLEKVIGVAGDLVPPMMERRVPFCEQTVHTAMASILAAIVLVRPLGDMNQAVRHLASAFAGLAAITDPLFAARADDVILLVRS